MVCTWGPNLNRVQTIHRGLSCFSLMEDRQLKLVRKQYLVLTHRRLEQLLELGAIPMKVYLAMHFWANKQTKELFPSAKRIMNVAKVSNPKFWDALKDLENMGMIKRQQRPGHSTIITLLD